jgi:hypothetical protein
MGTDSTDSFQRYENLKGAMEKIFKAADASEQVEDIWKSKTENVDILEVCVCIVKLWWDFPFQI